MAIDLMTEQQHPITPSDEMVHNWRHLWVTVPSNDREPDLKRYLVTQASQWGWDQRGAANEAELQQRADQELDACVQLLDINGCPDKWIDMLRVARRPKPQSLKNRALKAARRFYAKGHFGCTEKEVTDDFNAICSALERLEELEGQGND